MANKQRANMTPSKRTAMYARQLRQNKNGQLPRQMTATEGSYRSGYIQKAGDDAQTYKYKAAIAAGYTKSEAKMIANKKHPAELQGITSEVVFKRNGKKLNGKQ